MTPKCVAVEQRGIECCADVIGVTESELTWVLCLWDWPQLK